METIPTDFPFMFYFSQSSSSGDSVNLDTKSVRICPLMEVQGIDLISKASRIVPHFAILPMKSAFRSIDWRGSLVRTTAM